MGKTKRMEQNCVTPSFPMCSVCENGRFKTETLLSSAFTVCEQGHQMALDYANWKEYNNACLSLCVCIYSIWYVRRAEYLDILASNQEDKWPPCDHNNMEIWKSGKILNCGGCCAICNCLSLTFYTARNTQSLVAPVLTCFKYVADIKFRMIIYLQKTIKLMR